MTAYDRENPPPQHDHDAPTRQVEQVDRQAVYQETREPNYYEDDHARRVDIYRRVAAVIWTITAFVEILVTIRVIFKLIGANAGNGFVSFIYDVSGVFVAPFQGIVQDVTSGSSTLEINSLIAMLIFVLVAWGVLKLFWLILMVTEPSDN